MKKKLTIRDGLELLERTIWRMTQTDSMADEIEIVRKHYCNMLDSVSPETRRVRKRKSPSNRQLLTLRYFYRVRDGRYRYPLSFQVDDCPALERMFGYLESKGGIFFHQPIYRISPAGIKFIEGLLK